MSVGAHPDWSQRPVTPRASPRSDWHTEDSRAAQQDPPGAAPGRADEVQPPMPTRIEYFAPCTLGVEAALTAELHDLGAREISTRPGGVSFLGDRRLGYAGNLWLRSAIRVQDLLLRVTARGKDALYDAVGRIDWSRLMRLDQTLAVDASVRDSELTHSGFVGLTVKDAIVDQFRVRTGRRPSVDADNPDLPLKVVLKRDVLTIWRNLSGDSLHKRGYRPVQVKSPLNEATAAGLLRLSGWDRASPLVDPMCGSGTLLIEAAMLATDRAPGMSRRFAFERWPEFDAILWRGMLDEARARAKATLPFSIEGADRHVGAISIAARSAHNAGVSSLVRFTVADAADWTPALSADGSGAARGPLTVLTNPPYGERIGEGDDLVASWRALGRFLSERCHGGRAFVLCGNREMLPHVGRDTARQFSVMNGQIECRLIEYDLR
jgi:putative N6-adenine-specific DNA methylase